MKLDADLILLLAQGDEKAFEYIFNRFFDELCSFARSITKDRNIAEDLVEDIFLHLWINCQNNPVKVSLKSYLFQCTYNNAIKYVSRKKKLISLSGNNNTLTDDEQPYDFPAEDYSINRLTADELSTSMEKAIGLLPDQCKTIYLMNRDEDLNYRQIAQKLSISESTVKTQMGRAYTKLKENLKDFFL
jgi:RNA polymerase sigma-70 factor (family 1)